MAAPAATAARFADYGSEENQQVIDIIHNVVEHGDKAVAEYTEKFDDVKLRPDDFRVSQRKLPPYDETRNYVSKIRRLYPAARRPR